MPFLSFPANPGWGRVKEFVELRLQTKSQPKTYIDIYIYILDNYYSYCTLVANNLLPTPNDRENGWNWSLWDCKKSIASIDAYKGMFCKELSVLPFNFAQPISRRHLAQSILPNLSCTAYLAWLICNSSETEHLGHPISHSWSISCTANQFWTDILRGPFGIAIATHPCISWRPYQCVRRREGLWVFVQKIHSWVCFVEKLWISRINWDWKCTLGGPEYVWIEDHANGHHWSKCMSSRGDSV